MSRVRRLSVQVHGGLVDAYFVLKKRGTVVCFRKETADLTITGVGIGMGQWRFPCGVERASALSLTRCSFTCLIIA